MYAECASDTMAQRCGGYEHKNAWNDMSVNRKLLCRLKINTIPKTEHIQFDFVCCVYAIGAKKTIGKWDGKMCKEVSLRNKIAILYGLQT